MGWALIAISVLGLRRMSHRGGHRGHHWFWIIGCIICVGAALHYWILPRRHAGAQRPPRPIGMGSRLFSWVHPYMHWSMLAYWGWVGAGLVLGTALWYCLRHPASPSSAPFRRSVRRGADPVALLRSMTPEGFESSMARLMTQMGYRGAHRVGGAGDLGVDIEATDAYGRHCIAQCKRYGEQHRVGSPEMQLFIGMAYTHHQVPRGCALYFTTAEFTEPALRLAQQHGIVAIGAADLRQLLSQAPLTAAA